MNKNYKIGQIVLIALVVLIAIAAFFYFLTNCDTIKKYRDGFKEKADELRRQIKEKEDFIEWLEREIEEQKMRKGELIKRAKRIFMICKLALLAIVILVAVIVHCLYSVHFIQALFGFFTMVGIVFSAVIVIVWNEVGNVNSILLYLHKLFVDWSFKLHSFEPKLIEVLEDQLILEKSLVIQMKKELESRDF